MIDDLEGAPNESSFDCDICIVGAGPAGLAIAKELLGSGLMVCVVESGGFEEEPRTDTLNAGFSVGHPARMEGRYRAFGGSSIRWGGRCAPLDPIDFVQRDWVNFSGWPVSHAQMQPYYERAKAASNFGGLWFADKEALSSIGVSMPQFKLGKIKPFIWRVAGPDAEQVSGWNSYFGARQFFDYGQALRQALTRSPNIRVLLHATMTDYYPAEAGASIAAIRVSSLTRRAATVKAKAFILCGGGIENARLLLSAPEVLLRRVNRYDTVGRFLMQHPRGCIGAVEAEVPVARRLQRLFNYFLRPSGTPIEYDVGFALTDEAQREHGLLNASVFVRYARGEQTAWEAAKRLRSALAARRGYDGLVADGTMVLGLPSEIPNLARGFLGFPLSHKRPVIRAYIDLEQEPTPESRLTLSDACDALGCRRVQADWRISPLERRTAAFFGQFLQEELALLGLGRFKPADWLSSEAPLTDDHLIGTYHYIGTTRMSDDPREGVVNSDCRTHGVENLYLAGCSVFPTGGHANPTLTIVALAIRLADHLRARLRA